MKTHSQQNSPHCENAFEIASFLEEHEAIEKIYYPGLSNHPNHEIAKKQMNGFGGMITVVLKGGLKTATTFLERTNTRLPKYKLLFEEAAEGIDVHWSLIAAISY